MSYRIEDLKEAFEIYVLKSEADFHLDDKIDVHGEMHNFSWLLNQLKTCTNRMPVALCEYLEVNSDTTYSEAIKGIRQELKS